jgi:hypothetical protein
MHRGSGILQTHRHRRRTLHLKGTMREMFSDIDCRLTLLGQCYSTSTCSESASLELAVVCVQQNFALRLSISDIVPCKQFLSIKSG